MNTKTQIPVPEIKLAYSSKIKASDRPAVKSSMDAHNLFKSIWDPDIIDLQEQFKVLLLNRANKVLAYFSASSGGVSGTVVDIRIIMMAAVNAAASGIMLAHNHPSGSLKPSRADEELTIKIRNAARFFDIKVLDHIILTSDSYYSFADEGLL